MLFLLRKRKLSVPKPGENKTAVLSGLLDAGGNVLYLPLDGAVDGASGANRMPPLVPPDDQRDPQQSDRAGRTPRTANREGR